MEHIEFALRVLKDQIYRLNKELKMESLSNKQKDEVMQEIQRLNRAVMDIQKHFNK